MRCTQYNHDSECAANNAQGKTHKDPCKTSANHEETPRETLTQPQCKPCVLTGSRHTRLQNPATHRTTPGNTGRNQPKAPPRHRRQLDRKAHKPACNVCQERKKPPGSRIVPRNSTNLKSKSAYRHHQPVRFLFCPISPRSRQDTKRDRRKESI